MGTGAHRSLELAARLERDGDAHLLAPDLVGACVAEQVPIDEDLLGGREETRPALKQVVDARLVGIGYGGTRGAVDDEALQLEADLALACVCAGGGAQQACQRLLVAGKGGLFALGGPGFALRRLFVVRCFSAHGFLRVRVSRRLVLRADSGVCNLCLFITHKHSRLIPNLSCTVGHG